MTDNAETARSLLAEAGIAAPTGIELAEVHGVLVTLGAGVAAQSARHLAAVRPKPPVRRIEALVSDIEEVQS